MRYDVQLLKSNHTLEELDIASSNVGTPGMASSFGLATEKAGWLSTKLELRHNKAVRAYHHMLRLRFTTPSLPPPLSTTLAPRAHPDSDETDQQHQQPQHHAETDDRPLDLGTLEHLDLRAANLAILPPLLFQLTSLQELILSDNGLSSIPQEISNLSCLRFLCLNTNRLSSLPSEITW